MKNDNVQPTESAAAVFEPRSFWKSRKFFFGLGAFALVGGIAGLAHWTSTGGSMNGPRSPELESRPAFAALKTHVEKLAEIDEICRHQEKTICYCELAERIRDEHQAIERLLVEDPTLRHFNITVEVEERKPASIAVSYDLKKLPQPPDEQQCLGSVSTPTLLDGDS